jgi:hypothetical protein
LPSLSAPWIVLGSTLPTSGLVAPRATFASGFPRLRASLASFAAFSRLRSGHPPVSLPAVGPRQLASPPVGLRCPPPRDIEVVVESALSLVVVVSALWNWRFRCRFPPLRFGVFRHWTFVFCGTSRRAALASAWASSTVLMRCHSFVGGARPTWK